MAYDDELASRIRELIGGEPALTEKRMFGGLAFLMGGHMAVAASSRGGLMVRVDPAASEALVAKPGVTRMEMNGRQMSGWLVVDLEHLRTRRQLQTWVDRGLAYVAGLPEKPPRAAGERRRR